METLADYEESVLSQRIKLVPGSYRKDVSTTIVRVTYKEKITRDVIEGSVIGAQVGGLALGAVAAGVMIAFTPVIWLPLMCVGIGMIAGGIIGGILGSSNSHDRVKLFDAITGDFLGENSVQASKNMIMRAVDQFIKGNYDKAKAYFEAAHLYNPKAENIKNIEACELLKEAKNFMNQNKFNEASVKLEESMGKASHYLMRDQIHVLILEIRTIDDDGDEERRRQYEDKLRFIEIHKERVKNRAERKRQELQKEYFMKVNSAERKSRLVKVILEESLTLEIQGDLNESKNKLNEALQLIRETRDIHPENSDLQNMHAMISLKYEENFFFQEGVNAQKRAKEYEEEENFDDALDEYKFAESKFKQGLRNDKRFGYLLSIVKEQILSTEQRKGILMKDSLTPRRFSTNDDEMEERWEEVDNTENQVDYNTSYDF